MITFEAYRKWPFLLELRLLYCMKISNREIKMPQKMHFELNRFFLKKMNWNNDFEF